jgi:hypothetical protein
MADEFFNRFNEKLVGPAPAAAEEAMLAPAEGPWLTGVYVFVAAFVVAFVIIWLAS